MNFFARIGSAWGTLVGKAAPPGNYGAGWGGGSWFSDAFRTRRAPTSHELVDAYKSLVYACVNLNANAVARLPLRLYATTHRGQPRPRCEVKSVSRFAQQRLAQLGYAAKAMAHAERVEEVTDHPLLDAVMRVNDDLDHAQLLTYTVMSLDIVGSAYWWPSIGRHGVPEEFWALPPHLVSPQFTSGSMVPDSYLFGGVAYPKDSLIRFRRLSARNPYGQGYGPEQAAIEYARLEDTFVSIQDDMLSNGPRPSVIVSHKDPKGTFGTAERSRLEADMNRKGRGGRAGAAFVVDGSVAVTPISYTPTDLGTKELSLYDLERIANCFDVPVSMLRTEDVNRANAEAGLEQHGRNGVEPRCKLIASALTRWTRSLDVSGARGWDRLLWAFDPAVNADRRAEAELHKTYVSMGLPLNVALTEAGYDAVAGGDVPLVLGGLKPLDAILEGRPGADRPSPTGESRPGGDQGAGPVAPTQKNCGTGAGGFQLGNTCARGRGGSASGSSGEGRQPGEPLRSAEMSRVGRNASARARVPRGAPSSASGSSRADAGPRSTTGRPTESGWGGIGEALGGLWDEARKIKDAVANLEGEEREVALDLVGMALDIVGIFEPTPFADLGSAGLSAYRRQYRDAFLSALGVFTWLGDSAKAAKIPGYIKKVRKAIALAGNPTSRFAKLIRPMLEQLGGVLQRLDGPLRSVPEKLSRPLRSLRDEIDRFFKKPHKGSVEGAATGPVPPARTSVGTNPPTEPRPSRPRKREPKSEAAVSDKPGATAGDGPKATPSTPKSQMPKAAARGKPKAKPKTTARRKPKAKADERIATPNASRPKKSRAKRDAEKPVDTRESTGRADAPDPTAPDPKKRDSSQEEYVRSKQTRLPKDGTWDGTPGHSNFKPNNPAELGLEPDDVIPFRNGRPDLSKWSKENFASKEPLTGSNSDRDRMIRTIAKEKGWTQNKVQEWLKSSDVRLHHSGGNDFQLIPSKLHDGIRHTGPAYDLRNPR